MIVNGGTQQANLALEARASQDVYGSGPQTFPYVGFFPEVWYGGGGGGKADQPSNRRHVFYNLGFEPSLAEDSVHIRAGTVYCGFQPVTVKPEAGITVSSGEVFLNISVDRWGHFTAELGTSAEGDASVLLYKVNDFTLDDYVVGTMFIPYYN